MGCGALCGSTIIVSQSTTRSKDIFRNLLYEIKPNNLLISSSIYQQICKDFQLNPSNYFLKPNHGLQPNSCLPSGIKQKWKLVLYGLDSNLQIYVNCLGYSQKNQNQLSEEVQGSYNRCQQRQKQSNEIKLPKIYPHIAFSQIEKDKDRTFQLPLSQKPIFSTILKRIASFFPKMGYTQGINFIVCYLLKIGYSERDAFWLFVHIALNRKYMLLGLFQDGFPLSAVYIAIFKKVLKRQVSLVYNHFYEKLQMNDLLWVFKWFTTYFLCSFPLQMGMYVWNFVIEKGGLGLVNYAVALVKVLQKKLLSLQDDSEVSMFFDQLKKLEAFNQYVKLQDVLRYAYSININDSDCKDLNFETQIPYSQYVTYCIKIENLQKKAHLKNDTEEIVINGVKFQNRKEIQDRMEKILEKWYSELITERNQFIKSNGINDKQRANKMRIGQSKLNKKKSKDLVITKFSSNSQIVEQQQQQSSNQSYQDSKYSTQQQYSSHLSNFKTLKNKSSYQNLRLSHQQISESASTSFSKVYSDELSFQQRTKKLGLIKNPTKINELWDEQDDFELPQQRKKKHNTFNINKVDIENQFQQHKNSRNIEHHNVRKRSNTKNQFLSDIDENSENSALKDRHDVPNFRQQQIAKKNFIQDIRTKVKTQQEKLYAHSKNINKSNDALSLKNYEQSEIQKNSRNVFLKKQPDSISQASDVSNFQVQYKPNGKNKPSQNKSKMLMTGKSIMSSMSISNASISNKSSTSSKNTHSKDFNSGHKQQHAHRYCNCHKNKTGDSIRRKDEDLKCQAHDPEDILDRSIGRKVSKPYNQQYGKKFNYGESDKKTPIYQQWMINSNSQGPQNRHNKQRQTVNYEAELYQGHLFKKKNKKNPQIMRGIGLITVENPNSNEKSKQSSIFLQSNTMRNQHQQSCQSIFIQNFSQNQSSGISARGNCDAFQIESVK